MMQKFSDSALSTEPPDGYDTHREEAVMERTSAACAMEWSVDLEKGLRSKKPGQPLEAILRIGPRLELWDREPAISKAQYAMFELIPGEDRLFANTILLRLTDAFSSGDKQTKVCIVKVFLSLVRNRKRRRGHYDGILFKCSCENHLELLRRVKIVFDSGDVESRALALVLFGCLADVAKDSADIRYLILSSLVSFEVLQVEASLFAAGCFCELSDDFATILLEILVNLVTSSETLSTVRLAGLRAFGKMGYSSSLAINAYEAGLKLVLGYSEEDFLITMLISLSKLASKSACLIDGQVDLLLSFLNQEKPLRLQATALKCLHFIVVRGICHFPASAVSLKTLVSVLVEYEFLPTLQCGALQILHKVLLCNLPTMACLDMFEFSGLLTILENSTQSLVMAKRLSAIHVIVDILVNFRGTKESALDGTDLTTLASRMISLVMDQISLLAKVVLDHQLDSKVERAGQSLLSFLLLLVENYPDLSGMVLDKMCSFIQNIMNKREQVMGSEELGLSVNEDIEFGGQNRNIFTSKILLSLSRVVVVCLENLNEAGAINSQALDTVELLIKHVQQCSLLDCFIHAVYSFLLHPHVNHCCMMNEIDRNDNLARNFEEYLVQHEILILKCAKSSLARKNNWSAYKVGKHAAYQGAWFTAAFIFEHLITTVQSNTCYQWLKSLAEFAHSERKVQLLTLRDQGFSLVNWLEINRTAVIPLRDDLGERGRGTDWRLTLPDIINNFIEACSSLHSAEETMGDIMTSGHALWFQRWFVALRAKVLESVADILKLYCTPFTEDNFNSDRQVEGSIVVEDPGFSRKITFMACSLTQISLRLNRLAGEFDLVSTSFRGMDKKSMEIVSALALSCSLLAFSTGFCLFFPNLYNENNKGRAEECLHGMLLQDLVWRLQQTDCETSMKVGLLWRFCRRPKTSFLQSRSQILNISCEARCLVTACRYAVTGVVALHESSRGHDNEILHQVPKDGLQLLLDIITKWMLIPFRTPNHFFRVRPCISSELFVLNNDTRSTVGLSVLPGSHLSLNLCVQLKHVAQDLQLTKLYCILHCRTSFRLPSSGAIKGQMQLSCRDWEADEMVYLNDQLLRYVSGGFKMANKPQYKQNTGVCGVADTFVRFEPNEKQQGFSTCLLDVSAFPPGSYIIKWHSCCLDDKGTYWSLLPLNAGPVFTVQRDRPKG